VILAGWSAADTGTAATALINAIQSW